MENQYNYDCWECPWKPKGEYFCGTCIQKILHDLAIEKQIQEGTYDRENAQ